MASGHSSNNVFVHTIDHKNTIDTNYYHGMSHTHGDFICYSPAVPYKGEGSDFYALYYEHFMRQDALHGRNAANARMQFWTPNKFITNTNKIANAHICGSSNIPNFACTPSRWIHARKRTTK